MGIFHQTEVQEDGLTRGNPNDSKFCPSVEFTYSQDLRVQDIFLPVITVVSKFSKLLIHSLL
jgi:hypothetical protein